MPSVAWSSLFSLSIVEKERIAADRAQHIQAQAKKGMAPFCDGLISKSSAGKRNGRNVRMVKFITVRYVTTLNKLNTPLFAVSKVRSPSIRSQSAYIGGAKSSTRHFELGSISAILLLNPINQEA